LEGTVAALKATTHIAKKKKSKEHRFIECPFIRTGFSGSNKIRAEDS